MRLQLACIEASTLRAPEGLHDDRAGACTLAVAGLTWRPAVQESTAVEAVDPLRVFEESGW